MGFFLILIFLINIFVIWIYIDRLFKVSKNILLSTVSVTFITIVAIINIIILVNPFSFFDINWEWKTNFDFSISIVEIIFFSVIEILMLKKYPEVSFIKKQNYNIKNSKVKHLLVMESLLVNVLSSILMLAIIILFTFYPNKIINEISDYGIPSYINLLLWIGFTILILDLFFKILIRALYKTSLNLQNIFGNLLLVIGYIVLLCGVYNYGNSTWVGNSLKEWLMTYYTNLFSYILIYILLNSILLNISSIAYNINITKIFKKNNPKVQS